MSRAPGVKICGLTRRADAELASRSGATHLGVVLAPGGKRSMTVAAAAELFRDLSPRRVGVFVDARADEVAEAAERIGLDVVQLHGDESPELVRALRASGREVWKAVRPRSAAEFLAAVERYGAVADALLLDGWSAEAAGGTGARFPWDEVALHRGRLPAGCALVVAGGLRPENVARAVALLRPEVVDVSSGVESAPGIKDTVAVLAFIDRARGAAPAALGTGEVA